MPKTVAVIIPTRNRPGDLDLTLETILQQRVLPGQLIIVDQSGSEETQYRVRKRYAEAPLPIRKKVELCYIRDAAITGLTVARNRAMEVARGDICLRSFERKLLCDRGRHLAATLRLVRAV